MRGEKDREEDEDHGVFTTHDSRVTTYGGGDQIPDMLEIG